MIPAGQAAQHRGRLISVGGLAEQLAVQQDLGVDAENDPPGPVDRARLAGCACERVADGALVERRGDDLERNPELRQDRPALRRRRREDERRGYASPSGNQSPISRAADSGESEP